jgi:endonuclease YncB( thermonuclease family)
VLVLCDPSSTETLSSWERLGGPTPRKASRSARTQRARPACQVNRRDLGDVMVRRGFAIGYLRYSGEHMEAEVETRQPRRVLWQGDFIEPEIWQHSGKRGQ